ncbi:protein arginine kinase [Yeguia hominis]|uniref:Protein-arginine kinase n=1 Tax=Yeguia hominis TaxID=2763662 RepID=A0A926HSG4_9FIRM|nr:protein arginine kinase [Yeguia hominis]MBC8533810.1 protein arginine kinase [Yeguia hominis]
MLETKKWYEKSGAEGDVIISTRIRLARNLRTCPFPSRMNTEDRERVISAVQKAIETSPIANEFVLYRLKDLSQITRVSLVERHLVSPEFISHPEGRAVLLMKDESVSIMVNEEDHLRIQVMCEGFNFEGALQMADRLDTLLGESLNFAFDDKLGYLTQCPTNLGTGMRASLMLHLPALQETGTINRISANLSKLGLTIRGTYGEASQPVGALYQLSNQVTLGLSEQEAIDNLKSIALQLMKQERSARAELEKDLEVQDSICRSVGLLRNARLLSNDEFMKLISNVRLGINTGLIDHISLETVNALTVRVQPATIQLPEGKALSSAQRDALRAKLVREALTE